MSRRGVQLRVGGQTYRVVSSASAEDLERLAGVVEAKLQEVAPPGRAVGPQAMLLAALSLAHDVELERERADEVSQRAREAFSRLITRVDEVLESVDEDDADLDDARHLASPPVE